MGAAAYMVFMAHTAEQANGFVTLQCMDESRTQGIHQRRHRQTCVNHVHATCRCRSHYISAKCEGAGDAAVLAVTGARPGHVANRNIAPVKRACWGPGSGETPIVAYTIGVQKKEAKKWRQNT